jgi:hypothetical protein
MMNREIIDRREREFSKARTADDVASLQRKWLAEDAAHERSQSAEAQERARLARELHDARARIAQLERVLLSPDRKSVSKHLCSAVAGTIATAIKSVRAEIPKFCGVFAAGQVYRRNSLCVRQGGLWIATEDTTVAPGTGQGWTLCVKSGSKGLEA